MLTSLTPYRWANPAHTNIVGVSCHKYHFCRGKTPLLSGQTYACRHKRFVAIKLCLSQQTCVCRDKCFVATNICCSKHNFCRDKLTFVVITRVCRDKTRLLSRQNYACHNKTFVARKVILVAAPTPRSHQFINDVLVTRYALKAEKGYSGPMRFSVFYLQTV